MVKPIISLSDVSFSYENIPVLEHISFNVNQGEFLGIIGPNGSGKTTLLKLMLGVLKPDTGEISLFRTPIQKFTQWGDIGYVPQKAGLSSIHFPITVQEVVQMGTFHRLSKGWISTQERNIALQSLDRVHMLSYKDNILHHLSGGQQQKVFIARALASNPKVLILDEPTVGIDQESQESFYTLLHTLHVEQGITLILISHDVDTIAKEVTSIMCLNGTMICHGKPESVFSSETLQHMYGKHSGKIHHERHI